MNERAVQVLGWMATAGSVSMSVSYIDQIMLNIAGTKGSVIQPAVTFMACLLWVLYGALLKKPNKLLVCANFPGVVLTAVTFVTAL